MTKIILQDIHVNRQKKPEGSGGTERKWEYSDDENMIKKNKHNGNVKISKKVTSVGSTKMRMPGGKFRKNLKNKFNLQNKKLAKYILMAVIIFLLGLFFVVYSHVGGTVIEIVPKQQTKNIDKIFEAKKNVDSALQYQITVVDDEISKNVRATKEEVVVSKASGKVIVYNKYSKGSVSLIKNTRFESSEGMIFRIVNRVSVPGYKEDSDGSIIPGSLEITVYADDVGVEYNIGKKDFSIPGLKDFPDMYSNIYARSKTSISGGYDGVLKTASDDKIQSAISELRSSLSDKLFAKVGGSITDDYILFDDGMFVLFENIVGTDSIIDDKDNSAIQVSVKGTLYGVIFKKSQISGVIASKLLSSYRGSPVMVKNLDSLVFDFTDKASFDPLLTDSFNFKLSGDAHIVWDFDKEELKNLLVGIPKDDFQDVIKEYGDILKAKAILKPFWRRTFPSKVDQIEIVEIDDSNLPFNIKDEYTI